MKYIKKSITHKLSLLRKEVSKMAERKMPMRRGMGMPKVKVPKGTFKRLMKFVFKYYKVQLYYPG